MARENEAPESGAIVAVGDVKSSIGTAPVGTIESHTHEIGLIIPPPDIKVVADKTAQFVAQHGAWCLKRITCASV